MSDYLLELGKIVEGALSGDQQKVAAYSLQLSDKLEAAGEIAQAKKFRKLIHGDRTGKFEVVDAGTSIATPLGSPIPTDLDTSLPTADEARPKAEDVALFLNSDVERIVKDFLRYFKAADRLHAKGVGITASMLIYGPPGCGKTLMANWIAAQLQLPIIIARMDGLISSYLGSTAKNIRLLFDHAVSRPCVLFLDEFDAIAKMRDDSRELGELKRVVISLLQNIDGMSKDHVLLAATNHEHLLDKAIWRRFAYRIHMAEPNEKTKKAMLVHFLGEYAADEIVDIIACLSKGLTGAQLRHIADECIRAAVLADRPEILPAEAAQITLESNPQVANGISLTLPEQVRLLKELNPKAFSQTRLARIFGVSQPQISRYLKEKDRATD